jgi:hypothetical protein
MWSPIVHGYNWDVDSFSTIQVDMVPTSFNFNECNSKFEFPTNALSLLWYDLSFIHPYYMSHYPFIHYSYYMPHYLFIHSSIL